MIHAILDNYAAHKHPQVLAWLAEHPRWTFHFTPTSCSWLNAVEGFFSKLTRQSLKRGVFRSVDDLEGAITRYIAATNRNPKPFVWKATAKTIQAKLTLNHPSGVSARQARVAVRSERGKTALRCAVYTRVSTEHGLEQEFNSLDNQREASEAYVKSQAHEGWRLIRTHYDDGGYSGGSMDRPALQRLLDDVRARRIDVIVVYKVDRLTRSLADFAKLVELFDAHQVSFVSVTQAFNTTTSMGRLTLNVLLSFAQFEREVTGERIRDKIAASKRKGIWMGGVVPLGLSG